MEFPITIESQDDFDSMVKDRISRVQNKYADYDDLKSKAQRLAEVEAEHKTALDELTQRAEAAETWKAEREQADELTTLRDAVAKDKGIPPEHVGALKGNSKEELEAHAASLKPLITAAQRLVIPSQGEQPPTGPGDSEERAAVRGLFGAGDTD